MKQKYLLIISFFFLSLSYAQTTKNVYFIGNSYTETYNIPELVKKIAQSTNDILNYQKHTPGGSRFQQHASNPIVLNKIGEGNWDYVVLQEQSQLPSFPQQQLESMVYPYAKQLVDAVKQANPCGSALFYMTWGRKNGDAQNCANGLDYLCTYEGMDDALYNSYMHMATTNSSLISPVGKVWRAIREQYPNIALHDLDDSHPTYIGSMTAAYTFYTVIFKKDPTLTTEIGNLSQANADIIKGIVKAVVFDNLETWFIGVNDIPSDFRSVPMQNRTYQFESLNPTATTYLWDFGDGTTSDLQNPEHTYQANGSYEVRLTTNACGVNSTKIRTLEITSLSTPEFNQNKLRMYPNPANDVVTLSDIEFDTIKVFDALGKEMRVGISGNQLDIRSLQSGIYFIQVQKGASQHTVKLLKK